MTTVSPWCARCGLANPNDARFCIGCGQSLAPAATGATTKLAGTPCMSCRTMNPDDARFCVQCGRDLMPASMPKPAARPARPRTVAAPRPAPRAPHWQGHARQQRGNSFGSSVFFVLGLLFLLATHMIWPGILLLAGVVMYADAARNGRQRQGVRVLVWLAGLTILFATHTLWPGIMVLALIGWLFS